MKPIDSELKATLARAKAAIRPEVRAAFVIAEFGGHSDVAPLAVQLEIGMNDVRKNDLRECEAMLYSQAHALQAIFVDAAIRVPDQEWFSNSESFMRMALKAQSQCRATLETLAQIKNPPVVFARQANIAQGPQQVNNQMMPAGEPRAGAGKTENAPNKLSGGGAAMSYYRTPEHRARQSAAIQQWRPWKHSTGPKSEEGKARVSRNAYKGGTRAMLRELARLLREQGDALKRIG